VGVLVNLIRLAALAVPAGTALCALVAWHRMRVRPL
jgi:hypothetical protein